MIRMEMCKNYAGHRIYGHPAFVYTLQHASASIKEQRPPTCLNESRRPHPITRQFWAARALECHYNIYFFAGCSLKHNV